MERTAGMHRGRPRLTTHSVLVFMTALPWSVLMTVGGLWLVTRGGQMMSTATQREPSPLQGVLIVGGVFWIAAGHLLFMSLVADRLFPRAHKTLVAGFEVLTTVLLFACAVLLVVLGVQAFGGGSP